MIPCGSLWCYKVGKWENLAKIFASWARKAIILWFCTLRLGETMIDSSASWLMPAWSIRKKLRRRKAKVLPLPVLRCCSNSGNICLKTASANDLHSLTQLYQRACVQPAWFQHHVREPCYIMPRRSTQRLTTSGPSLSRILLTQWMSRAWAKHLRNPNAIMTSQDYWPTMSLIAAWCSLHLHVFFPKWLKDNEGQPECSQVLQQLGQLMINYFCPAWQARCPSLRISRTFSARTIRSPSATTKHDIHIALQCSSYHRMIPAKSIKILKWF